MSRQGWIVIDDFNANAFNHSASFWSSRKLSALLVALRNDLICVAVDSDFCRPEARAESVIYGEVLGLDLNWIFFTNDYPAREAKIRRRGRAWQAADLENFRKYSDLYHIPPGTETIQIRCEKCIIATSIAHY